MNKKIITIISSFILGLNSYAIEFYNNNGAELNINGIIGAGIISNNYTFENEHNNKTGLYEEIGLFQLNFKKSFNGIEVGGDLNYGLPWENNTERTGGDLYLKYNFSDKLWVQYQKFDFAYLRFDGVYNAYGKNLGTGSQLTLMPVKMILDPVLSDVEVDYGVAFLGVGATDAQWIGGASLPNGSIWNAHMAYKDNTVNYVLIPNALNFGYNNEKLSLSTSLVYANQEISDINSNGNHSKTELEDKGVTLKGVYNISDKTNLGVGAAYGCGKDTGTATTKIMSQNIYMNTTLNGFDFFGEFGHSTYEVDSSSGSEKELIGAYGKVSKFTKAGIPYLELKVAQSTFDKVYGTTYSSPQKNTLVETKAGIIIPVKKLMGASFNLSTKYGTYKSANDGNSGTDVNTTQLVATSNFTYVF